MYIVCIIIYIYIYIYIVFFKLFASLRGGRFAGIHFQNPFLKKMYYSVMVYISFVCLVTARRVFFPRGSTSWILGVLLCLGNKHIATIGTKWRRRRRLRRRRRRRWGPNNSPSLAGPRGYHAQGSNIPFGESLTLIKICKNT